MKIFKRKSQSSCRAGFYKFCDTVKRVEVDKDYFLKSARLTRHEAPPVVTANNVLKIAAIIGGTIVMSTAIVCIYLGANPMALILVGLVGLFGAAMMMAMFAA